MHSSVKRAARAAAIIATTALVLSACGGGSDGTPTPHLRATQYGAVAGVDDSAHSGTLFWKGIPFAQAPVGDLRWKAPVAPDAWDGRLDASTFGASCIQNPRLYSPGNHNTFDATVGDNMTTGHTPGSEDCLTLNIWRPASGGDELPVIVFIHGGSNITGYSADPMYDGAALARAANAVVVTANYRLGQLGFFYHPALRDRGADPTLTEDDRSGNFAILDIIQALHFVQDNIRAFGGDPGNVTLSGQSAGAINILAVLTAPGMRTAGLFHRIASLSGGISTASSPGFPQPANDLAGNNGYIPGVNPVPTYEALSTGLLMKLLIDDSTAGDAAAAAVWIAGHSSAEVADYLRGKPAATILRVGLATIGGMGNTTGSGPIPEGTVVASDPIAAIQSGNYPRMPVLAGLARSESKLLSTYLPLVGYPAGIKLADADLFPILFDPARASTARFGDIISGAYPDGASYDVAIDELDRKFFDAMHDNLMDSLATQTPGQIWSYRFDWKREPAPWNDVYGAAHAFDLPFLFGNFGPSLYSNVIVTPDNEPGRLDLSQAMMQSLAAFAATGNPNHAGLDLSWPNWPQRIVFDADDHARHITVE